MSTNDLTQDSDVSPVQPISLDLLKMINDNQSRHGIREGSHLRYRKYCTNRLHSVRKTLGFSQATKNHKFKRRALEPSNYSSELALSIPLLTAERAWAQAMYLQSDMGNVATSRSLARSQVIRRLAAAADAARELRKACAHNTTASTQLQAEAYAAWLEGSHALERSDFATSLKHFLIADKVYSELSRVAELELRALCDERSSQLRLYIAFCQNRLKSQSSDEEGNGDKDVALLASQTAQASELSDYLREKFDIVMQESLLKRSTSWRTLTFDGVEITIRDERIRVGLLTCETLNTQLDALLKKDDSMDDSTNDNDEESLSPTSASALTLYNKLISTYDDMIVIIKDLIAGVRRTTTQTASIQQEAYELTCLLEYAQFSKLSLSLQRNAQRCFKLCDKFEREIIASVVSKTQSTGGAAEAPEDNFAFACVSMLASLISGTNRLGSSISSSVKPSSLVTLFDRLLQNLDDFLDVLPQKSEASEEDSENHRKVLALRREIYGVLRAFYVGLCYIFQQRSIPNAFVILQEVTQSFTSIIAKLNNLDSNSLATLEAEKIICDRVSVLAQRALFRVQGLAIAQQHLLNASVSSSLSSLSVSDDQAQESSSSFQGTDSDEALLQRLSIFSAGRENSSHAQKYRLLDFPPKFTTTTVKPFLFDLAGSALEYPDFSHRVKVDLKEKRAQELARQKEEEANKGFWGRIFG